MTGGEATVWAVIVLWGIAAGYLLWGSTRR